jgi:hypothetical protein
MNTGKLKDLKECQWRKNVNCENVKAGFYCIYLSGNTAIGKHVKTTHFKSCYFFTNTFVSFTHQTLIILCKAMICSLLSSHLKKKGISNKSKFIVQYSTHIFQINSLLCCIPHSPSCSFTADAKLITLHTTPHKI